MAPPLGGTMHCPKCKSIRIGVVYSRSLTTSNNNAIKRLRKCDHCGHRFSTIEVEYDRRKGKTFTITVS